MSKILDWLLEDENPAVRYRTLTELMDSPTDNEEVLECKGKLINSKFVTDIMSKMNEDGTWTNDKELFGDFTNFYFLTALAEFGLTRHDIPIDNAVNWVLTYLKSKHRCGEATLMRNLVMLGYLDDNRVKSTIDEILGTQKDDGGWGCVSSNRKINDPRLPHKSCIRITGNSLLLIAELKRKGVECSQTPRLMEYYAKRNLFYRTDDLKSLVIADNGRTGGRMIDTFYPIDPVKMGIQCYLYALAVLGQGNRREFEDAWERLNTKKNSEGKYIMDGTLTKQYFTAGKKGKPNKWVTLYALLALKYREKYSK